MLGTWGMDPSGAVVDEHKIVSVLCASDREALRRFENGTEHFTVFENCPRVAKTVIRSSQSALGMMFNDAGAPGDAVDEPKQAQLAVLCSMLGTMLDPVRGWRVRCSVPPGSSPSQRLVAATVEMLDRDPALGTKAMATELHISESRLAAVFKALMGISLVDYRNVLRLDRFEALLDGGPASLMRRGVRGRVRQLRAVLSGLPSAAAHQPAEVSEGLRQWSAADGGSNRSAEPLARREPVEVRRQDGVVPGALGHELGHAGDPATCRRERHPVGGGDLADAHPFDMENDAPNNDRSRAPSCSRRRVRCRTTFRVSSSASSARGPSRRRG